MFKTQIETILHLDASSREYFRGVYAIDQLPRLASSAAYVINYDESDEEGSHWVALFNHKGSIDYFDSTGNPPLDIRLQQFIGDTYSYNPFQLQQVLGNACGFYSTYYILQRSRNKSSNDMLRLLTRTNSDYIVKKFLYNHYKPIFS